MHIVWKTLQIYKYKDFDLFLHICWCCVVFFVCLFFIIIFIIYFILFYLCVLFTFIFVCVCVCGFFVSMGRVFNGRRVCGSLQLYQRQEFNKTNCCLCCLLFRFKIRDIFSYYSCVLWL